jgi:putative tryptophan/tyrosine transport system substrate-binding protein
MAIRIGRRDFITLLGAAGVAWPLAANAQQGDRVRRIGVLMQTADDDPEARVDLAAFLQGLEESGWTLGRNVQIDYRWGGVDAERARTYMTELLALTPDILLAVGDPVAAALQQATHTVPTVFVDVTDPVGRGFGSSAKWLELLKQVAPELRRVAVIWDPGGPVGLAEDLQSVAPSFGVELRLIAARDAGAIERGVTAFRGLRDPFLLMRPRRTADGLIVTLGRSATVHRDLIITLATRYRLPAVYPNRFFATDGGLMSYGPDFVDQFRRAGGYVGRILKGEKPADLPVQTPTKFELTINLRTARALGFTIPPALLARADEVIK